MNLSELYTAILLVCPIEGVSSGGRIDFLPEATDGQRAAAQKVFDNWVDPIPPDWQAFRIALYADEAWKRVLNSNPAVGATIASILWQFQTDPTLAAEVKFLWDSLIPGLDPALSVDEITALNLIAIDNNIPMSIEDDGFLSFSG